MTAEEFETGYCSRSNISLEFYRHWFVTMPCACDYEECKGWAAIRNNPDCVEHQEMFCSPQKEEE